ncbi:MAG: hypothetical protein ACRDSE_23275, partial [Pseudonocardiaceae bacterium]
PAYRSADFGRSGAQQVSPALQPKPVPAPSAPADVPAMPGLDALPAGLDALPTGLDSLPAAPVAPEGGVAMPMPAPAMPAAPEADSLRSSVPAASEMAAAPELPADSLAPQVQPGEVNAGQTGMSGMFAKFVGLMTGKSFSMQG